MYCIGFTGAVLAAGASHGADAPPSAARHIEWHRTRGDIVRVVLSRLEVIADAELPAGSVLWMFDQTDMVAAKQALGGYACIAGNVPTPLLALGTAAEVEQYVTRLLDRCARDGGFFLRSGAVLDDAKAENLKAMIDAGRTWRG